MTQGKIKVTDQEILDIFNTDTTLNKASAKLNMSSISLCRRTKKLGLKWVDKKNHGGGFEIPLSEILEGKHPYYQTGHLKLRLIKKGIKENKCEECHITDWNGKSLNMQLDHIDGNPHNHLLENLKMLCPNCHSQTETFCGKI
jgi:hypothetical protein